MRAVTGARQCGVVQRVAYGGAPVVTVALGTGAILRHAPLQPTPCAEQTMAMPALPLDLASRRWTVEEVRALNEASATTRYECVDGELLVTPGPSLDHQDVIGRLYRRISDYLDQQRIGHPFFAPADVRLTADSLMQPDLFVAPLVEGARPRAVEVGHRLLLAVEVLSPRSGRGDRVVKRMLHQRVGTPEYWVVDVDARVVERWRPADARPEIVDGVLSWHPEGATAPLELDLARLLAE